MLLVRGRSKEHNEDAVMTQVAPADGEFIIFIDILIISPTTHGTVLARILI